MKKFKASIAKWTDDNLKTNAFYDIGLRVLMVANIVDSMFEKYLDITYIVLMPGSLIIVIVFIIFLVINYIKRHKKGNLFSYAHTWNGIIAVYLFTGGLLVGLPNSFMRHKIVILSLIAIVLLTGSIVFYVLGYKELLKAEKSQ